MQDFNFHGHTYRCKHADFDYSDEDYVKEAIKSGLKVMCFTDHAPNSVDKRTNMRMGYEERYDYYDSIDSLKEKYKDKIDIYKGFEVEYTGDNEEELKMFKKETDFLILGQHFIISDGNVKIANYSKYTDEDLKNYTETIEKALELGIISVLAHPDFVFLARNSFDDADEEMAHKICMACEKNNVPIEINLNKIFAKTYFDYSNKTLRPYEKPEYYFDKLEGIKYPMKRFWEIASLYDIKVLYGIDSHYKGQISLYKELKEIANHIIGKEIIDKLEFCDLNDLINDKKREIKN